YSEEELYENPWEDLINKKNSATYLTGVMTTKIEKDSVTSNMSENLTNNKIIKANETLMNNWDIFVKNISEKGQTMELGRTNIVCHQIDTGRAKPIKQRAYRVAPNEQTFLESEIRAIEQRGEDVNMMDIKEEDLATKQEAFKATIQKHTTISKVEAIQIENTSSWRTYHSHYLKQRITRCEANFLGDYIHNKLKERERVNIYLTDVVQMHNIGAKTFYIEQKVENTNLKKETAVFNDWYHNTDNWSIEETIPVSEEWSELVTESETNMWNLPDPYSWKTSTNEPELLLLPTNPVPW
ncbi:16897_t:CDS:2, partial [Gigaspora margarita]